MTYTNEEFDEYYWTYIYTYIGVTSGVLVLTYGHIILRTVRFVYIMILMLANVLFFPTAGKYDYIEFGDLYRDLETAWASMFSPWIGNMNVVTAMFGPIVYVTKVTDWKIALDFLLSFDHLALLLTITESIDPKTILAYWDIIIPLQAVDLAAEILYSLFYYIFFFVLWVDPNKSILWLGDTGNNYVQVIFDWIHMIVYPLRFAMHITLIYYLITWDRELKFVKREDEMNETTENDGDVIVEQPDNGTDDVEMPDYVTSDEIEAVKT